MLTSIVLQPILFCDSKNKSCSECPETHFGLNIILKSGEILFLSTTTEAAVIYATVL